MRTIHYKIYVSGKISGLPIETAIKNFEITKKSLRHQLSKFESKRETDGVETKLWIIVPFDIRPFCGIKTWLFYMINDLRVLRTCETIVMQKDWTDSRGAVIEYFFAKFIFKINVKIL